TAATALTIAFLGPYGSYDQPLEQRIVTSFANGFLAGIWIWPAMRFVLRRGAQAGLPDLFTMVAGLTVIAAPVALLSHGVSLALDTNRNTPPLVLYFS